MLKEPFVNRERKICLFKECKPSRWWKEVKKLGGITPSSETHDDIIKSLKHIVGSSDTSSGDLANIINAAFLAPMNSFQPLPDDALSNYTSTDSGLYCLC